MCMGVHVCMCVCMCLCACMRACVLFMCACMHRCVLPSLHPNYIRAAAQNLFTERHRSFGLKSVYRPLVEPVFLGGDFKGPHIKQ